MYFWKILASITPFASCLSIPVDDAGMSMFNSTSFFQDIEPEPKCFNADKGAGQPRYVRELCAGLVSDYIKSLPNGNLAWTTDEERATGAPKNLPIVLNRPSGAGSTSGCTLVIASSLPNNYQTFSKEIVLFAARRVLWECFLRLNRVGQTFVGGSDSIYVDFNIEKPQS